jgi:hypothetical protein
MRPAVPRAARVPQAGADAQGVSSLLLVLLVGWIAGSALVVALCRAAAAGDAAEVVGASATNGLTRSRRFAG